MKAAALDGAAAMERGERTARVPGLGEPGDVAACRALLARGSKSFSAAALLLPRRVRDASAVLYAFCRVADDAVDLSSEEGRVDRLRRRLARVYTGDGLEGPVDRAFSDLVRGYDLPIEVFSALLEGFEWDARGRTYETLGDTLAYSARVASTVGAAMTVIMGAREPQMVARACDLGLAMQLTNICRDVGEDAHNGRLYLPAEWLRREGVDPAAFLRDPRPLPGVRRVVLQLLEIADGLYTMADAGLAELPAGVRPAMIAARLVYADIGRVIRRAEGDSVTSRAVVSGARKAGLLGRAVLASFGPTSSLLREPEAPEAAFLVEAIHRAGAGA